MAKASTSMTLDLSTKTDEELAEVLDFGQTWLLADKAKQGFTVEAFEAFFEGGHGTPLHPEAKQWVRNVFAAHQEGLGLAQEAFRGSAKTTVFSKYLVAFYIGHHPEKCNLIVRINDSKSNESTEAISFIIEHTEFWKLCFPHVVPDKAKGWGAEGYEVKREDISYAKWARIKAGMPPDPTFVGRGWKSGSIIGSRVNGMLVVDDIHNEDNVSGIQLASVKKFITDTLFPVMMDGAWEIWNFTPWTEDDVYAYILSTGQYKHNKSPVIIEDEDGEEWPEDPQIPLSGKSYRFTWPRDGEHGWDFNKLSKTYKQQGQLGFARMYLLDLKAAEGQTLKAEWLEPPYPYISLKNTWPSWLGVDFASSADQTIARNKELDYFVLAHGITIPGENKFILTDGIREHMELGEATIRLETYAAQLPYLRWIGVEAVGGGLEFARGLIRTTSLPIHSCKPSDTYAASQGKSKGARFQNWMSGYFQFGRASIIEAERVFINHFRNEWLTFPDGKHDDCLDGVFWAMWVAALFGGLVMRQSSNYVGETTNPMFKVKKKKTSPYSGLGAYRG